LRIVDIADPDAPQEVGWFVPEPARGRAGPLTNDVDMDDRGVLYVVDRGPRFDVLEFKRPRGRSRASARPAASSNRRRASALAEE
jgi:hypothetical protein